MKKLALLIALIAVPLARADKILLPPVSQIVGGINFAGAVALDNENLVQAGLVEDWFSSSGGFGTLSVVPGATGVYAFIAPGTAAVMATPWNFLQGPQPALWSVGGFTFDLMHSHVVNQTPFFLNVLGDGLVSKNGFLRTDATWSFTINNSDGKEHAIFSVAANLDSAGVPDNGSTVMLLGLGLSALGLVRYK